MSGQLWGQDTVGGYLYSDNLSDYLRFQLQPRVKFRSLCDAKDDAIGLNQGSTYRWNVYANIATRGRPLSETARMPETNFTVEQRSLIITEFGNSVPYTGLLTDLAEHDAEVIIDQTLRDDARKVFDRMTAYQFMQTPLRVTPTAGNSTTSVTLVDDGTPTITNNVAMGADHVKAISDLMKERNIPTFSGDDYAAIGHPTTFRNFKNDLEAIHQYTETGLAQIFAGEVGRYESIRFIEQNEIPKGHAADAEWTETEGDTNDIYTAVDDAWNQGLSSWALFFGADTVIESPAIPEEIRAKIPDDYGRSKGIAYYYLGGAGLCHPDATNARIVKWDSAA